jgi:hypothetical protein
MPANPGQKRNSEKQKKKRAAAQQQRKARNLAMRAREAAKAAEEPEVEEGAAPHPFATDEVDYDALDEANEEIRKLIKKKNLDEAEKKARELADQFPKLSDGLQRLAEVLEKRGDKKGALAALKEAQKRPNEGDEEAAEEIETAIARLS